MNLFPKKKDRVRSYELANHVLEMSRINPLRTSLSLTMDEIEKICVAYLKLIEDFEIPQDFIHQDIKPSIDLTEKLISEDLDDWELSSSTDRISNSAPQFEISFK